MFALRGPARTYCVRVSLRCHPRRSIRGLLLRRLRRFVFAWQSLSIYSTTQSLLPIKSSTNAATVHSRHPVLNALHAVVLRLLIDIDIETKVDS